eukprot:gene37443-46191_t
MGGGFRVGRRCSTVKPMQGLHLTADLYQCRCDAAWLTDAARLGPCEPALPHVAVTPPGPRGVTATVLLAKSHLCVHTWPEERAVTLDVYVCNFGGDHSAKARALMDALVDRFTPEWTEQRVMGGMTAQAMILAAGRGERMRPLTDAAPKPLLEVRGKPLMQWPMEALAAGGFTRQLANTAWLGEQIEHRYGDWLTYSHEGRDFGGALETGGGIATALPLLGADGDAAFWAVSGDIYMPGFEFDPAKAAAFAASEQLAHLWMVPTQAQHPQGDFAIDADGHVRADGGPLQVFANIGLYRPALFGVIRAGERQRMRVALDHGIALGRITAELHDGPWINVGTPEQLDALNAT